jgi:hypothetical protein
MIFMFYLWKGGVFVGLLDAIKYMEHIESQNGFFGFEDGCDVIIKGLKEWVEQEWDAGNRIKASKLNKVKENIAKRKTDYFREKNSNEAY